MEGNLSTVRKGSLESSLDEAGGKCGGNGSVGFRVATLNFRGFSRVAGGGTMGK